MFYLFTLEVHYRTRVEVPWRQGPYWFRSYCAPSSDGVPWRGGLGCVCIRDAKLKGCREAEEIGGEWLGVLAQHEYPLLPTF